MSFTLYFGPGACSFVPHTLLQASGAEFETRMLKLHKGEQRSPEFLALNPHGQVPLLQHTVGGHTHALNQIVAICLYLHQHFPQANWLPDAGRNPVAHAQALSDFLWMNSVVHGTFAHIFMPGKFTADEAAQASIKAQAVTQYADHLARMEQQISQRSTAYWCGEHWGPLDAYILTLLRWGSIAGIPPTDYPATWAFVQRFAQLPAVAAVIERERLKLNMMDA